MIAGRPVGAGASLGLELNLGLGLALELTLALGLELIFDAEWRWVWRQGVSLGCAIVLEAGLGLKSETPVQMRGCLALSSVRGFHGYIPGRLGLESRRSWDFDRVSETASGRLARPLADANSVRRAGMRIWRPYERLTLAKSTLCS